MPETEPQKNDLLGSRPGFEDWSNDIMSELEARERLTPEEAPQRKRFARSDDRERQPLPSRFLSWFSGNG